MDITTAIAHRMDFLAHRQGIVAGNLANANTPNYGTRDLDFRALTEQALGDAGLRSTNSKHLAGTGGAAAGGKLTQQNFPLRLDGNAVVVEEEMLKMGAIRGDYAMMTGIYTKYAQMYHTAISTGR